MRPDRVAGFPLDRVNQGGGLRVSFSEARRKRAAEPRLMPGTRYRAPVDDIDARIVAFLIRDARASYSLIGGEVGLSAPAVKRGVDRLLAAGAITGFSARVDPAAMGWTTEGCVELFCGGRTSPEE